MGWWTACVQGRRVDGWDCLASGVGAAVNGVGLLLRVFGTFEVDDKAEDAEDVLRGARAGAGCA